MQADLEEIISNFKENEAEIVEMEKQVAQLKSDNDTL